MVGITSAGVYVPVYRLGRDEIARMWGGGSLSGEKAVAGYDEDSITMAVAATLDCLARWNGEGKVDGLFFATTTAPYGEKLAAAIVGGAVDLARECRTADFANSLRAGTTGIKAAMDAVECGSANNIIVTASDCRIGAPQSNLEQMLGDGAVALMIGSSDLMATIEGGYSVFNEFTDLWKTRRDTFIRSAEGRFIDDAGYLPIMQEVISSLMKRYEITAREFSKLVFYAHDARQHASLARNLGFDKAQVQDPLFANIGNTGTAAALIMLTAALEEATPGDRIIFASYGDGCDAFIIRATEGVRRIRQKSVMKDRLARNIPINYGRYASWRNLVEIEASRLPERPAPSIPRLWRERRSILALYGVKCNRCGTPQYPPIGQLIRVCAVCKAKDDFQDYKFSTRTGKLFSYAIDSLQFTQNPPGVNGVVDFDGGGRLICELTDCEPRKAKVGMPVEMTFRKLYQSGGINNYFWKAKPVEEWGLH